MINNVNQPTALLNIAKKEGYTSPNISTRDKVQYFVLNVLNIVDPTGVVNDIIYAKYTQPAIQERVGMVEAEYAAKA